MYAAAVPADVVYINADIYTVDNEVPRATAMAVRGGKLTGVGADADIIGLAGPDTAVVDLEGAFVLPGMGDMHQHWDMCPLQTRSGFTTAAGRQPARQLLSPLSSHTLRALRGRERRRSLRVCALPSRPVRAARRRTPGEGAGAPHPSPQPLCSWRQRRPFQQIPATR